MSFSLCRALVFLSTIHFLSPSTSAAGRHLTDGFMAMKDEGEPEATRPLKITFNAPAKHWTDALPIGNGRLGAMVWGGFPSETVNLNDDTLWNGYPGDYTDPNAPKAVAEVRKLVNDGRFDEATAVADTKLSGNSSSAYQPIGDLKLDFNTSDAKSYKRELDLDTATVKVKYTVGGVRFTREHFASNPDQVIVTRISASKPGSISFTAYFGSEMHHESFVNGDNQIIIQGHCYGGIDFSSVVDIQIGGKNGIIHRMNKELRVEKSDWAVLVVAASSSFVDPFTSPAKSKKDPTKESLSTLALAKKASYSELYNRHLVDYQKLYRRVSLQLSKSRNSANQLPTPDRVKSFHIDEDPALIELLFQYGRYLLISCSRPGTQPANLQGIWSKDTHPPWDAAPHLNINLQMNYWPSLPCNLRETQEPLFDYITSLSVNGGKTARVNYNASGWVAHQVSDVWAKSSPDAGLALWAFWPMGGAWLCTHLWEHYTFTMDATFLEKKAYPLMEGCAAFLLDWLIEGRDGNLETNPSTSPEHYFIAPNGKQASVSYSSTMDMLIIKEVFSTVLSAAEILGKKQDGLVKRVAEARTRLPPTRIAKDGSIMEWAEEFKDPEPHHRHVSHLFGIYPGRTITLEKDPDLCRAAEKTLIKRGEDGPGWSTTWKAALWARLRNSEHAYRMVKHLIDLVDPDREGEFEGGLYGNLFAAHPPFQIDANFGLSGAVSEMLVQSTMKDLYLLPALPRDKWADGCVRGLKARGGLTISICWKEGDLHQVAVSSSRNGLEHTKRLHYRGGVVKARVSPGKVYTYDRNMKCVQVFSSPEEA